MLIYFGKSTRSILWTFESALLGIFSPTQFFQPYPSLLKNSALT